VSSGSVSCMGGVSMGGSNASVKELKRSVMMFGSFMIVLSAFCARVRYRHDVVVKAVLASACASR